jgi:hypothetical protein
MLRAYIMEYQGSWDKNLPWAELSYNNSYQESLKMAPFEVLYGRRCRTSLNWVELGEKVIFGPNLVEEAETTTRRIQGNLKPQNHINRLMQTRGVGLWNSKLKIMCI